MAKPLLIVLALVIVGCQDQEPPAQTPPQQAPVAEKPAATPQAAKPPLKMPVWDTTPHYPPGYVRQPSWQNVAIFEGSEVRKTEPFTVSSGEWRVHWESDPTDKYNLFTCLVKSPVDEYDAQTVATSSYAPPSGASDTSYFYKPGIYYLDMNVMRTHYRVVVEQLSD